MCSYSCHIFMPVCHSAVPYVFMAYKKGVYGIHTKGGAIAYYVTYNAEHDVRVPEALGENLVCASP